MEQDDFPKDGITLAGIHAFLEANGGRDAFQGLLTEDVNKKFIAEITSATRSSYCTQYAGDSNIKAATVFVSHAWKYVFLDVVTALEDWAVNNPDAVFWIDLFSNCQHGTESKPFTWWRGCFCDNIKLLGHLSSRCFSGETPSPYGASGACGRSPARWTRELGWK